MSAVPTVGNAERDAFPRNAAPPCIEQPSFIGTGRGQLFSILYAPESGRAQRGLLCCHALGEEKLWSQRVFVTFARELAAKGIAVLRFDFRGEGDSDLEFEQTGIATRVEDTLCAARALAARLPDGAGVTVLGHRLGGSVAAAACALLGEHASGLVIWDPVLHGRDYLLQLLRGHLSSQLAVHGKVMRSRESLIEALRGGETLSIEGYGLTREFFGEIEALRLARLLDAVQCPTFLIEPRRSGEEALSEDLRMLCVERAGRRAAPAAEPPFWRESREFHRRAPAMSALTLRWLNGDLA